MEQRDSILFYRSFYEAISGLPKDIQLEIYTTVMEYGLNGNLTEHLKPVTKGMFALMKPIIDSNNVRRENGKKGADFGKRGGRPRKKDAPAEPVYNLSFEQEIERMKEDAQWKLSVCKDYNLTPEDYNDHLERFLKRCKDSRDGKPHDSIDDAKSHFRYWLDKGGCRTRKSQAAVPNGNIPPDYSFKGGFGGKDV